jgi:hypothetical protein
MLAEIDAGRGGCSGSVRRVRRVRRRGSAGTAIDCAIWKTLGAVEMGGTVERAQGRGL